MKLVLIDSLYCWEHRYQLCHIRPNYQPAILNFFENLLFWFPPRDSWSDFHQIWIRSSSDHAGKKLWIFCRYTKWFNASTKLLTWCQTTSEAVSLQSFNILDAFTLGINMRPVSGCCPHTHWKDKCKCASKRNVIWLACPGPEAVEDALWSDLRVMKTQSSHGVYIRRSTSCKTLPPLSRTVTRKTENNRRPTFADLFKYFAGKTDPIGYPDI